MNQNQHYPFERNRYYSGKLLASADFQAEQDYFTGKSRFMNSLMYGSGIICGMGTLNLDDLSVLVESGVAIDPLGREIVLDTMIVRKLSVIEGFDDLETDEAVLCIRAFDEPVHSVYTVRQDTDSSNYEFGRMAENYKIFLMDKRDMPMMLNMNDEFLTSGTLFSDADYKVELILPATVSRGRQVKLIVRTSGLGDGSRKLSFHSALQIPGFLNADLEQEIEVDIRDLYLSEGESCDQEFWLDVQKTEIDETLILMKSGTASASIDDKAVEVSKSFSVKVLFSDIKPRTLINREVGRVNLEMLTLVETVDYVPLAEVKLVKTAGSYVIESINEDIKRYICVPAHEMLRGEYLDYFYSGKNQQMGSIPQTTMIEERVQAPVERSLDVPEIASGVLEIPLAGEANRGGVFYSGEIMHGLGKGNVFVQIGLESIAEDSSLGANALSTIYGNADLFERDAVSIPAVETAVKVLNDKGSFVVAAQLQEDVDAVMLTYRWVAMRFPTVEEFEKPQDYENMSIVPETPTVVLGTRESYFFNVRYQNMKPCSINYELTEPNSGEITADGIYTAPNREGVYEIRIYCTDMPSICTYAYPIVKKQSLAEAEAAARELEKRESREAERTKLDVNDILK